MSPSGAIPGVLCRCHLGLHVMKKKARENNASFRFISPRQTDGRHASTICNDFSSLYCNAPRRYVLIFLFFSLFSADTPHAWTYLMMPSVSVYFLLPPRLALVLYVVYLCWYGLSCLFGSRKSGGYIYIGIEMCLSGSPHELVGLSTFTQS